MGVVRRRKRGRLLLRGHLLSRQGDGSACCSSCLIRFERVAQCRDLRHPSDWPSARCAIENTSLDTVIGCSDRLLLYHPSTLTVVLERLLERLCALQKTSH